MRKVEDIQVLQTKFKEEVFSTSDLVEMKGKYLAEKVVRKWEEDFVDEDNGNVVTIERKELLFEKGSLLSSDIISQINFYLQSQDIQEIKVSNQQRSGYISNGFTSVWSVTAKVNNKKQTYLLYANSMELAIKIITDFLEQEVSGGFVMNTVKELDYSNLVPVEEDDEDLDFYKIELEVEYEGQTPFNSSYILKSHDAESAKKIIMDFITKKGLEENRNDSFEVTIISAKTIPCYGIVNYKFSEEYFENQ